MLSRFLNTLVIIALCITPTNYEIFSTMMTTYLACGLISALLCTVMIVKVRRLKKPSLGLTSIVEVSPEFINYHQRVLLARLLSVIFMVQIFNHSAFSHIPLLITYHFFLEYYIYQVKILSTVAYEVLERHFPIEGK